MGRRIRQGPAPDLSCPVRRSGLETGFGGRAGGLGALCVRQLVRSQRRLCAQIRRGALLRGVTPGSWLACPRQLQALAVRACRRSSEARPRLEAALALARWPAHLPQSAAGRPAVALVVQLDRALVLVGVAGWGSRRGELSPALRPPRGARDESDDPALAEARAAPCPEDSATDSPGGNGKKRASTAGVLVSRRFVAAGGA
jgi:hypothetical protein